MSNEKPPLRPEDAIKQADMAFRTGDWATAAKFCRITLSNSPNHFFALTMLGIIAAQIGNPAEAEAFFGRAVQANPHNALAHTNFGNALLQSDKPENALQSYDRAIAINPGYAEAHNNRGQALQKLGQIDAAIESFNRSIKIKADYAEAYNNLGSALLLKKRPDDALKHLDRAISINPGFGEAHCNRGNALCDLDFFPEAIASYDRALAIRPEYADALNNRGLAFHRICEFENAIADYRKAFAIDPQHAEALNNLGNTLIETGQFQDAIANFNKAIQIRDDYPEAHNNLGVAMLKLKKPESALACFVQAISIKPDYPEAFSNRGDALMEIKQFDESIKSYRQAIDLKPDFHQAHSNLLFCMNFCHLIPQLEVLEEARNWNDRHAAPRHQRSIPHGNGGQIDRRLRVGYVSPDFRNHAVANFIIPLLANHNRRNVEVFCYYTHHVHDDTTSRLAALADHWIESKGKSDAQLADQIRSDSIDILIDLAGHTGHNRLLAFAEKPAPIAITYLGYPNTTGLDAIEYRITDAHADPLEHDEYYSEELLRLPNSLWCYAPPEDMPAITPLPALQNKFLTLGSFNNFNKIDAKCVALWAEMMRAIPDSRLVFATAPEGRPRSLIEEQFLTHGVNVNRLSFHGMLTNREFRHLIQKVDVTLDPVTVNGATSTCESLWLGVPVISLVGTRFLSRAGFSILSAAGMPEFALHSVSDCIGLARHIADDLSGLSRLRASMRDRISNSPLTNGALFAANIEQVYRTIWTKWCNRLA